MVSTVGASIFHWFVAYYLAVSCDMRMTGIAIASSLQFVVRALISIVCVYLDKDLEKCLLPILHEDSWKGLGDMAKLGFSSILLKVMGWWALEIFTQLASFEAVQALAGQTILRNIGLFTYMIPAGL